MKSRSFNFFRILILVILVLSLFVILVYLPSARQEIGQLSQVSNAYASFARFLGFDAYLGWIFVLQSLAFFVSWLTAVSIWFLYSHQQHPASPAIFLTSAVLALLPLLQYPGLNALPPGLPGVWNSVFTWIAVSLGFAAFPSLVLLFFIFPDGRFNPRWSRWLAIPLICLFIAAGILIFLAPDSYFSAILQLTLLLNMAMGIVFQIIAFSRLAPSERRRSWPITLALLLLPVLFILPDFVPVSSQASIALFSQFAMLLILPLSVWAALGLLKLWSDLRKPGWSGRTASIAAIAGIVLLVPVVVIQANYVRPIPEVVIQPLPVSDQPRPIIIDTDMAPDDWIAILYLLQRPEVDVKAITVTGTGEAHCEPGVRHAAALVALAGESPIPVACGRESPLQGAHAFPDSWREYVDNLAGLSLPAGSNPTPDLSAADLLRQEIAAAPEPLTVLALGPLTNLAEIVQADPSLAERFQVFLMGGALEALGNVGPSEPSIANQVAEWNIYVDPLALKILLDAGVPLTLVPLDATQDAPVTFAFLRLIQSNAFTPEARFVGDLLAAQVGKISDGFYNFWDPLAAAILVDESLAVIRLGDLVVTTQEGPTSGMTRLRSGGAPVRYASGAYGSRFYDDFLQSLNQP